MNWLAYSSSGPSGSPVFLEKGSTSGTNADVTATEGAEAS